MKEYRLYLTIATFMVGTPLSAMTLSTWAPWEIDSAVTAWYLKRYVNSDLEFESLAKGVSIDRDKSIDIPDSPYRRDAKSTALDSAIKMHSVSSACIEELRGLVRVLELTPWRKSANHGAEVFEREFFPLLPKQTVASGLDQAFGYLDEFCKKETGNE